MPLTKGNLVPATLTNLITGDIVYFLFNPSELTISKNNDWGPADGKGDSGKGKNIPIIVFKKGGAQKMKLQLTFDTLEQKLDVRKAYTNLIWKMMMIDESTKNAKSDKSEPPKVEFKWGEISFVGVIKDISQKFTLFLEDGTPVRTTVDVSLEQVTDEYSYPSQRPGDPPPSTRDATIASLSSRLDAIAASKTGSSSNYRSVAEASNIDNPKKVAPGTPISVPK